MVAVLDVLVALVFAGMCILALVALAVMREVAVLQERVAAFSQLLEGRHQPKANSVLPSAMRERIATLAAQDADRLLLLFMESGCSSCRDLAADLATPGSAGRLFTEDLVVILPERARERPIASDAKLFARNVIIDEGDALMEACGIASTPTVMIVRLTDFLVTEVKIGGDSKWIREKLATISGRPAAALSS